MSSSGPCIFGLPFVVAGVLLGYEIGLDDDADVGGVELLVDDGAITDKAAQSQVSLDQRRQGPHCPSRIYGAGSESAHLNVAIGESPRTQRKGCEMISMQIRKRRGKSIGVGTRQAGTAEHQDDVIMKDIGSNAAPQQLHRRTIAISGIDARAAQLENFSGMEHDGRNIEFLGRIETA